MALNTSYTEATPTAHGDLDLQSLIFRDPTDTEMTPKKIAIISILTTSNVLMLGGNSFSIYIISKSRSLRRHTYYWLVLNLAVLDLLNSLLVVPLNIAWEFYGYWPWSEALCDIEVFFDLGFSIVAAYSTVLLSLDKYLYINKPFLYYSYVGPRCTLGSIVTTWLVWMSYSAASVFGGLARSTKGYKYAFPLDKCNFVLRHSFAITSFVLVFVIPLVILVFTSTRILCVARKHIKNMYANRCASEGITNSLDMSVCTPTAGQNTSSEMSVCTAMVGQSTSSDMSVCTAMEGENTSSDTSVCTPTVGQNTSSDMSVCTATAGQNASSDMSVCTATAGQNASSDMSVGTLTVGQNTSSDMSVYTATAGQNASSDMSVGTVTAGQNASSDMSVCTPTAGQNASSDMSVGTPTVGQNTSSDMSVCTATAGQNASSDMSVCTPTAGQNASSDMSVGTPTVGQNTSSDMLVCTPTAGQNTSSSSEPTHTPKPTPKDQPRSSLTNHLAVITAATYFSQTAPPLSVSSTNLTSTDNVSGECWGNIPKDNNTKQHNMLCANIPKDNNRQQHNNNNLKLPAAAVINKRKSTSRSFRAFGTVILVVLAYIVMFAPYWIATMVNLGCTCIKPLVFEDYLAPFYYMHSLVNPYIYMATDRRYKKAIRKMMVRSSLCRRWKRNSVVPDIHFSSVN